MNNSKIVLDNAEPEDNILFLQEQKGELAALVETINRVEASEDWQKLKKLVLDDVVANLERLLSHEASKKEVDVSEIYRLQGQLVWARKYADLKKLAESRKQQIEHIKNQLNEKIPRDGAL